VRKLVAFWLRGTLKEARAPQDLGDKLVNGDGDETEFAEWLDENGASIIDYLRCFLRMRVA
jgi:hypothetical protein